MFDLVAEVGFRGGDDLADRLLHAHAAQPDAGRLLVSAATELLGDLHNRESPLSAKVYADHAAIALREEHRDAHALERTRDGDLVVNVIGPSL